MNTKATNSNGIQKKLIMYSQVPRKENRKLPAKIIQGQPQTNREDH